MKIKGERGFSNKNKKEHCGFDQNALYFVVVKTTQPKFFKRPKAYANEKADADATGCLVTVVVCVKTTGAGPVANGNN